MSASTQAVSVEPSAKSIWSGRSLQIAEIAIALLWIAGACHYVLQRGSYAVALLIASAVLLGPRVYLLVKALVRPAAEVGPRIWMLLLALFLPEHLTSGGSVVLPHLVPLIATAVCLFADFFVAGSTSAEAWISMQHRAAGLLAALVVVYAAATTLLAILKLYAFGYIGQDIGYFMQCLYTGMHGELFASNQYHDLLYTHTVTSDFAGHNQPVLFLLLPIYWLYPHAETLFTFRNLCLALSAYPAYQLARWRLQPFPALALTIALLFAPAVLFQNFYDFAPLSLVGLPLLFALLFYERRQFAPYIAALLLCLFIREDLALAVGALAVIAFCTRRSARWSLVPGAIALGWSAFTWLYLLPHFQQGATSAVESCFAYLGNTPSAMLHNLVAHPQLVLTHKAIVYTKQLLTPFAIVLPFCSPMALAAVPLYIINVLGDPGCNAAIIFRHYSLIPSLLLFPGTVRAVQLVSISRRPRTVRVGTAALAILLASVTTTVLSISKAELAWWQKVSWQQEALQVLKQVPDQSALAVPRYLLPFAANRPAVFQSLRLLDYHHPDAEFIIVDRNEQRMGVTPTWDPHYRLLLADLADPTRFAHIYASSNFDVYRLIGPPLASVRSPASECCR